MKVVKSVKTAQNRHIPDQQCVSHLLTLFSLSDQNPGKTRRDEHLPTTRFTGRPPLTGCENWSKPWL